MALIDYLKLIKFRYHVTFLGVVVGALLFADKISLSLIQTLLLLYVSFNILLYGGLYTINGIADIKSDKRHPLKRKRPLPSKKISLTAAKIFALILIASGLFTAYAFFSNAILYIYFLFVILTLFYTFIAKRIPYLELLVNSITHPLRFIMGILLVSISLPYLLILAYFFMILGFACVRRTVEKDVKGWQAWSVLKFYSLNKLIFIKLFSFIIILLLAIVDNSVPKIFYVTIIMSYTSLVFGIYFSERIRGFFRQIWAQ